MFTMLAILVYLVAMAIPIYLLHRCHSQPWYWHALALAAGIAMGLVPIPPEMQKPAYDLVFGFVFIVLLTWGAGGLIFHRTHHGHSEKHA